MLTPYNIMSCRIDFHNQATMNAPTPARRYKPIPFWAATLGTAAGSRVADDAEASPVVVEEGGRVGEASLPVVDVVNEREVVDIAEDEDVFGSDNEARLAVGLKLLTGTDTTEVGGVRGDVGVPWVVWYTGTEAALLMLVIKKPWLS
jgi:hypothetical protein